MGRPEQARSFLATALVAILILTSALPTDARAPYPTVPLVDDGRFITNLSAPVIAPGQSGTLTFTLSDPLAMDMVGTMLTLQIYEFNAYPGNATESVPAHSVLLASSGALSSWTTNLTWPQGTTVVPGAPVAVQVQVSASSSAPSGTYAIRFSLTFTGNGTEYRLASRGEFSEAAWSSATSGPNGASTLNLSALGVSGIVPETAVLVRANPYPVALDVVLASALVLAAVGGYLAFRRPPKSRSGARTAEEPSQAPTAFGKSRKSDGD